MNNFLQTVYQYVTLQAVRQWMLTNLAALWRFFAKVTGDMFSNWNGDVDPARAIGYIVVLLFSGVFIWLTIADTYWHHHFDSMAFSAGVGVIAVQIIAAAAGVRLKQPSEIPMPPHDAEDAEQHLGAKPPKKKTLIRRMVHGAVQGAMDK